jgi:methionyl-tRNA synthetase
MQDYALHLMLTEIWRVVSETNRYFASEEPWKKAKTDPARMGTILYVTAETLRNIAIVAQPVIPTAAAKLLDLLGVAADQRSLAQVGASSRLTSGAKLPQPAPIFPRYVEAEEGPAASGKK